MCQEIGLKLMWDVSLLQISDAVTKLLLVEVNTHYQIRYGGFIHQEECANSWIIPKPRLCLNFAYLEGHHYLNQHKGIYNKNG
jgi:hypothetical protein